MFDTTSISKGVFVFNNEPKNTSKKRRGIQKSTTIKNKNNNNLARNPIWYDCFKVQWNRMENEINCIFDETFGPTIKNIIAHVKICYKQPIRDIPCICLVTGLNLSDSKSQFDNLIEKIKNECTQHICYLHRQDCNSTKTMMYAITNQLLQSSNINNEDEAVAVNRPEKKRLNYFARLYDWYKGLKGASKKGPKKIEPIVIVIPKCETINTNILQELILSSSVYINTLPIVLILGVSSTMSNLHRNLSYLAAQKLSMKIFQMPSPSHYLNKIIEKVFLNSDCPMLLGSTIFGLLLNIFTFYDSSVNGFVRNFKLVMLRHFNNKNLMASYMFGDKSGKSISKNLTHLDFEVCRRVMSFRKLVESQTPQCRINLLEDDEYLLESIKIEICILQKYLKMVFVVVRCLHILTSDLPKAPLGKQFREIYVKAVTLNKPITKTVEYKQCFQLLSHQSRNVLLEKLQKIYEYLLNNCDFASNNEVVQYKNNLKKFIDLLSTTNNHEGQSSTTVMLNKYKNRRDLKKTILEMSQSSCDQQIEYDKLRTNILETLQNMFAYCLVDPASLYFYELILYDDINFIQDHLFGNQRAAIHSALMNPYTYIQCACCENIVNKSTALRSSMPDLSIVYKLHLEYGKMINMYDWLMAFCSIVENGCTDQVPPEVQARFIRCVSEMEFLGFIKSSKRNIDHVTRLTWGG